MNIHICILLLGLSIGSLAQGTKEIHLNTSIEGVKVFTQGAQITRIGKTSLPVGRSKLIIKSLSPYMDQNSIQVKGNGNFTILSVNHRLDYLSEQERNEQLDSLQKVLADVTKEIDLKTSWNQVMDAKQKLLEANQNLGGDTGITYEQLEKIVSYYTVQLQAIKQQQINTKIEIDKLKKEQAKIQNQINQGNRRNELPSSEIVITVDSKNGSRAAFNVSYFTQNAGWYPKYDVRVNDISSHLQLEYKADIYQNTREDWDKVQLTLSNGNPNKSGTAPELSTWYLNFFQNKPMMSKRLNATGAISRAAAEPMMQNVVADEMDVELEEAIMPVATIKQNQTTVEIAVAEKYSIASNGDQFTVSLQQYDIDAQYEYYAVPKLDKDAFLMARITNWDQYNLLPGEASLFLEGTFVGNSFLDTYASTDTLAISLGRDPGISIERKKIDIYSKSNFIGPNKVETRGFDILVRNPKSTTINLKIFDQLPVSTRGEITVTSQEISGGQLNENTGEISWDLSIKPGEQEKLELKYEVKYPKRERVILE